MIKAELKQGTANGKNGEKFAYTYVLLTFPNGYQKRVFPEKDNFAEKFLFESMLNK
ncbi:MAG: hypothetical protein J6J11_08135 [Treponema sp.]|nr:hypothetical protein [Clostridia bacterium]MBP3608271.1 hypothetical protein [Treponema sp.]